MRTFTYFEFQIRPAEELLPFWGENCKNALIAAPATATSRSDQNLWRIRTTIPFKVHQTTWNFSIGDINGENKSLKTQMVEGEGCQSSHREMRFLKRRYLVT